MSTAVDFVDGRVSQEFLANPYSPVQPYGHTGRDYACPVGTPCYAIADGQVIWCGPGHMLPRVFATELMFIFGSPDSGNIMLIQHDGWVSAYCHLSNYPAGVDDGVHVKRGQVVALSGNTGRSTGPHLHIECILRPASPQPIWSRYNPKAQVDLENRVAAAQPVPVSQPNWRKNGNHVSNMRSAPKLSAAVVGEIPANRVDAFTGYVIGDHVDQGGVASNIWYVDNGEDGKGKPRYVWAGLFTEQKITGLPNLTIKEETPTGVQLAPNQRLVGPAGAQIRDAPNSNGKLLRAVEPNKIEAFTHYTIGQKVKIGNVESDIWYMDALGWVWSGVFTEQNTRGLTEFKPSVTPTPVPETPKPEVPAYTFTKDIPCVTEVAPAAEGNFQRNNFPDKPSKIVLHQFIAGEKRFDVHYSSVVNEFRTPDRQKSSNLVIEGKKIFQMVRYGDRPYHAGPNGNGHIGFETYGGQDPETKASVARAIYETEKFYGYKMELETHNKIMATQCGDEVNLMEYRQMADAIHALDAKPVVPDDRANERDVIERFQAWQKEQFLNRK